MSDPSSGSSFEKAPNCCQGLSNVESIVKSVQGPHPQKYTRNLKPQNVLI